uniref:Serum response factor-binding protein 1 n=1 Tax=Parastrongyloides trichosuri TaxID=131310 RepID=A0A0N5A4I1_PARTI
MSFGGDNYNDEIKICWRDSPKPLTAEARRELIQTNGIAKLLLEIVDEKKDPSIEDSPFVFRSNTLMPRKKRDEELPKDPEESPRARTIKKLRALKIKRYMNATEVCKEFQAKLKEEDELKEQKETENGGPTVSQILNTSISEETFVLDLNKKLGKETSTPMPKDYKIHEGSTVRRTLFKSQEEKENGVLTNSCNSVIKDSMDWTMSFEIPKKNIANENDKVELNVENKDFKVELNVEKEGVKVKESQKPNNNVEKSFISVFERKLESAGKRKKVRHTCGYTASIAAFKEAIRVRHDCDCEKNKQYEEDDDAFPRVNTFEKNDAAVLASNLESKAVVSDDDFSEDDEEFLAVVKDVASKKKESLKTVNVNVEIKNDIPSVPKPNMKVKIINYEINKPSEVMNRVVTENVSVVGKGVSKTTLVIQKNENVEPLVSKQTVCNMLAADVTKKVDLQKASSIAKTSVKQDVVQVITLKPKTFPVNRSSDLHKLKATGLIQLKKYDSFEDDSFDFNQANIKHNESDRKRKSDGVEKNIEDTSNLKKICVKPPGDDIDDDFYDESFDDILKNIAK